MEEKVEVAVYTQTMEELQGKMIMIIWEWITHRWRILKMKGIALGEDPERKHGKKV